MHRLSSSFLRIFSRSSEIKDVSDLSLHRFTQKHQQLAEASAGFSPCLSR